MNKVLINFAHPARTRSKINQALRAAVEGLDDVTINDLYANYPDFLIDVSREQSLCEDHDVIIFQHPFYWYSTPSIMKEWLDLVLQHDWAYGSQGKALEGKLFLQAITAGGDDSTYRRGGYNEFTIGELTSPYRATAKLCNMTWLPPFAVLGIHRGLPEPEVKVYAEDYRRAVIALRDGTLNIEQAGQGPYLNSDLNAIIRRP
jgi:glutathione-regulated potassium-efflux system ancillary protein KefG